MRKGYTSCYFQVNSQRQKTSEDTVLFPHVQQQLTNKIQEENQQTITGRDNQIKALEFRNEEHQHEI